MTCTAPLSTLTSMTAILKISQRCQQVFASIDVLSRLSRKLATPSCGRPSRTCTCNLRIPIFLRLIFVAIILHVDPLSSVSFARILDPCDSLRSIRSRAQRRDGSSRGNEDELAFIRSLAHALTAPTLWGGLAHGVRGRNQSTR
jgi:hypothetical protein